MRFINILLFMTFAVASLGKPVQISDQDVDGEADDSEYEYAEEETALHSNKKETSRNNVESEYNDLKGNQKLDTRRQQEANEDAASLETKDREEKSLDSTDNESETLNNPEDQPHDHGDFDPNTYIMSTVRTDVEPDKENVASKQKTKNEEYLFDKSYAHEDAERRAARDMKRNSQKHQARRYNHQYSENVENHRPRNSQRLRGRRDAESVNTDTSLNENVKGLDEEEAAIRKHVKRLTKDELEEFLNSLTDDKRLLLKKIMDNSEDDSIMKREITKKEGAALDMNGFNDNNQAEMRSLNVVANAETAPSSSVAPVSAAEVKDSKFENPNIVTAKVEPENTETKASGTSNEKTGISIELESNLQQAVPQVTTKVDIKRETKNEDQDVAESPRFESESTDREENLDKQLESENLENVDMTDETDNTDAELADSIKSLEESFPNPIAYDASWADSDMVPLHRVKRKGENNKYARCVHVPYRAENEEEDSGEGSEFEDDGFYDRTSNIAKSGNEREDNESKEEQENEKAGEKEGSCETEAPKSEKESNLGSDSDIVFAGSEGVNENIMYTRERRSDDEDTEDRGDSLEGNDLRSNAVKDKSRSVSNNFGGAPNYQENDAFGPLPRNYDSEAGRYKRVRLAKATKFNAEDQ